MSTKPAILIVGSGPTGLIAAITLRQSGIPIRVIEKRHSFHGGIRRTALQPRTQEVLASLGVLDDVMTIATPPLMIGAHGVGKEIVEEIKWAEEADASPGTPYVRPISVHQSVFEDVLRKHLENLGTKVELGVELVGIEQSEGSKTVLARLKSQDIEVNDEYEYIVAADGARGTTRKMLGISFIGKTEEGDKMFVANVECTDIDRTHWHRWGVFGVGVFFLKPVDPAPMFQIQAMGAELPNPLPQDDEGIQKMFDHISKSNDIKLKISTWISEWRANIRMVDRFSVGRVFLVGESAHCHSPAGGQGANTGILDAVSRAAVLTCTSDRSHHSNQANISWKLALVHKRLASPSLLQTYEDERMSVVAEMLNLTSDLHRLAFTRMPPSTLEARKRDGVPGDPMWRPRQGLQLGVTCRWSLIVFEGRETQNEAKIESAKVKVSPYGVAGAKLRAGDRAPDASFLVKTTTSVQTTLFDAIAGLEKHHILVFVGRTSIDLDTSISAIDKYRHDSLASTILLFPAGTHAPAIVPGTRSFVDSKRYAYTGFEVDETSRLYAVVRPDGMIGAFATDVEQLHRFFAGFASGVETAREFCQ